MPIHDWTRVDAGLFHHFHHSWTCTLCAALNDGILPPEYFAMVEQSNKGPIPDVLALELSIGKESANDMGESGRGGLAVATDPPAAQLVQQVVEMEAELYLRKTDRISVRHLDGQLVAAVEIVSPGNKASRAQIRAVVEKSSEQIRQNIHLLVIDLLPPGKRDPQGIHKAIWEEIADADVQLPPGEPLTLASYDAVNWTAYLNFVAVGEVLPSAPLFFQPDLYVPAPLEQSYQAAWKSFPAPLKGLLEGPNA